MQITLKNLFQKKSFELTSKEDSKLNKTLSVKDLTLFGIAAIVGAGIFSTIGTAAHQGGVGVILLFVFTAISCGFSAVCYAHLAARIPNSGSAYTYTYIIFGEFLAWIIGWDLFMEYAVSNVAVAISWSGYFQNFIKGFGFVIPTEFSFFNSNLHIDFPAAAITIIITYICYIGIEESKKINNILVIIKLAVLALIIGIGFFYVHTENWQPFAPNGYSGIITGISSIFFAYIGFDALSTTAEECKNPKKDIPKAMLLSLVISTLIYVLITLVITGIISYTKLNVADPLAFVFTSIGLNMFSGFISFISIITLSSVILVYQLGQPRIWMAMSRDGLLPKIFSKIHPIYKTPSFSTIITGILVMLPALFCDINSIVDLTSIGTLFAFCLVCAGVIYKTRVEETSQHANTFSIPYYNSRFFLSIAIFCLIILGVYFDFDFNVLLLNKILVASILLISTLAIIYQFSLIPTLGLIFNSCLILQLPADSWYRFLIWLGVGIIIYFTYSIKNSKLRTA